MSKNGTTGTQNVEDVMETAAASSFRMLTLCFNFIVEKKRNFGYIPG